VPWKKKGTSQKGCKEKPGLGKGSGGKNASQVLAGGKVLGALKKAQAEGGEQNGGN